jgi:Lar family restriction alleviation protein
MTNGEKFKTPDERANAFTHFCSSKLTGCNECELNRYKLLIECNYAWLDLEYKEEVELKPCPFCGGTPVMADNIETMRSLSYFVRCACGARFASALSVSAAAEMWNRRAK